MKKALQISIAKSLFNIEEDAYGVLNKYLDSVRTHFANTEEKDEIISDIEARIAEQFIETGHTVISINDVEQVIASMGKVEDFGDEQVISAEPTQGSTKQKKLYRSTDDVMVGGVCAGLAAYFGMDVLWVRIIFLVLLFFTGFGAGLYIVFWILIPEAKTASQKIEMTGSPINLESLSENVTERVNNFTKENRSKIEQTIAIPFEFLQRIFPLFWPVIRVTCGILLAFVAFCIIFALTFAVPFILINAPERFVDFPFREIISMSLVYLIIASGYLVIIIPSVIIFIFGIGFLRNKNLMNGTLGFTLLGIWSIALIVAGVSTSKAVISYKEFVETSPLFETVSQNLPLPAGAITNLDLTNGQHVTLIQGDTPALSIKGQRMYLENTTTTLENGTLKLSTKLIKGPCIFCDHSKSELTLTVPSLSSIKVNQGSRITTESFKSTDPMNISLSMGSRADVNIETPEFQSRIENGSRMELQGTASGATFVTTYGSDLHAGSFQADIIKANASFGSSMDIYPTKSLNATAETGSSINYTGTPTTTLSEQTGGSIHNDSEDHDVGNEEY
ncbi:MAG: GIN domain-containing protein [Candidatus Gracilibacteria bacterium]